MSPITVPLFVDGEGTSGGEVRYSIEELGVLEPADGSSSLVVLMRPDVVASGAGLTDITEHGGWRSYRPAAGAR